VGVLVVLLVVAGAVVEVCFVRQHMADTFSKCKGDVAALNAAEGSYSQAVDADTTKSALEITADQVADAATVDALKTAVSFTLPAPGACDPFMTYMTLASTDSQARTQARQYTSQTVALTADIKAVDDSKSAKDAADALATLQKEIKTAQALVKSSSGRVASGDKTRSALSTEIMAAQKLAANTTGTAAGTTASDYTAETTKLKTAEKKVTAAVGAKTTADKAAAQAAQSGGSYNGGSPSHSNGSVSQSSGGSGYRSPQSYCPADEIAGLPYRNGVPTCWTQAELDANKAAAAQRNAEFEAREDEVSKETGCAVTLNRNGLLYLLDQTSTPGHCSYTHDQAIQTYP
jgi:hypothetical protein